MTRAREGNEAGHSAEAHSTRGNASARHLEREVRDTGYTLVRNVERAATGAAHLQLLLTEETDARAVELSAIVARARQTLITERLAIAQAFAAYRRTARGRRPRD